MSNKINKLSDLYGMPSKVLEKMIASILEGNSELRQQLTKERAEHEETKRLLGELIEFVEDCSVSHNETRYLYRAKVLVNKIKDANKEGE